MPQLTQENSHRTSERLPAWFRQDLPDVGQTRKMKNLLLRSCLLTVCESARCPNTGRCWGRGVATFMILGDICTRGCGFCMVRTGHPAPPDREEPRRVALAVKELNLKYVVITSVSRDDLPDEGAGQFAGTVDEVRKVMPLTKVEVLTPDFSKKEESLKEVIKAGPDVIGHNIEMVRRLFPEIRPQADYGRSLDVLRKFKQLNPDMLIKSGFMVGLGETREEIAGLMKDILETGCDILTIGQYLAPTRLERHVPVKRFIPPEEFKEYEQLGLGLGFKYVKSGPLVRSSYFAEEAYKECLNVA